MVWFSSQAGSAAVLAEKKGLDMKPPSPALCKLAHVHHGLFPQAAHCMFQLGTLRDLGIPIGGTQGETRFSLK